MTDTDIIALYEARDESAIAETSRKYGAYCTKIAMNVLGNPQDAEEIVSDTLMNTWNAIPPERPAVFSSFIGKIARNLSLNRYKADRQQKRGGSQIPLLLSELEACVPSGTNVESAVDLALLEEVIDKFLATLPKNDRLFFMRRYWYGDSIEAVAERFAVSQSRVASALYRTRNKLKLVLESEEML